MTDSLRPFPPWATAYIAEWKQLLFLHEWEIQTKIVTHPGGDTDGNGGPGNEACVFLYPDVLVAKVEFREDIPDSLDQLSSDDAEHWQRVIIHELFHVRMARITQMVSENLLTEFGPAQRMMIDRLFHAEVEPVVEIMSHILHGLAYPDARSSHHQTD